MNAVFYTPRNFLAGLEASIRTFPADHVLLTQCGQDSTMIKIIEGNVMGATAEALLAAARADGFTIVIGFATPPDLREVAAHARRGMPLEDFPGALWSRTIPPGDHHA